MLENLDRSYGLVFSQRASSPWSAPALGRETRPTAIVQEDGPRRPGHRAARPFRAGRSTTDARVDPHLAGRSSTRRLQSSTGALAPTPAAIFDALEPIL